MRRRGELRRTRVEIADNKYDFDVGAPGHPWKDHFLRNCATVIGSVLAGPRKTSYNIHFEGYGQLNYRKPVVDYEKYGPKW